MFLRIGGNAVLPLDFRDMPTTSRLRPRQNQSAGQSPNTTIIIIIGAVAGVIALAFILVVARRKLAGRRETKYRLSNNDDDDSIHPTTRVRVNLSNPSRRNATNRDSTATTTTTTSNVDRNTSVRSVMTLPAYRPKASDTEQILGREGERDGIDVVVEHPTAEQEEELREQEMDALFQIRETRRRQIAEQEERRRERREARERHDAAAIAEVRERARAARTANPVEIDELRDEHNRIKQTRQRAVSSVSYADLGVARADGTRLRANSTESTERVGLLSDAASIGANSHRSPSSLSHRRERSTSSVLSIDTDHSGRHSPYLDTGGRRSRDRADSGATTPRYERRASATSYNGGAAHSAAGSSPEIIEAAEADLGSVDMPPHSPPGYDDVSLDEITPVHSRAPSPYPDPPPDYDYVRPSLDDRRSSHQSDRRSSYASGRRLSPPNPQGLGVMMTGGGSSEAAAEEEEDDERSSRRGSRGVGGTPQLPSLRLARLPQIVIEPSSAVPRR